MSIMKYVTLVFLLYPFFSEAQTKSSDTFVQTIDASFVTKKLKFKLTASIKAEPKNEIGGAALWVRVDNKKGGMGFFENMIRNLVKVNEWRTYSIEGVMDENSDKINIGGYCRFDGKFYFDNFELLIENDKGEMQKATLNNPDFETPSIENKIPGWVEGISASNPVRANAFTISSTEDRVHGKYALLIEGKNVPRDTTNLIGPVKGYTPQIGTLVTELNNLSTRVEEAVKSLSQPELDFLLDENANSIGALVMHLAATEKLFQINTFENRRTFNDEENEKWGDAYTLGAGARKKFTGKEISYYLDQYKEVRKKTLEELRKRNDDWLAITAPNGASNNHYQWFHVMEHQSSHLGQILLIKKRLPKPKQKTGEKVVIED